MIYVAHILGGPFGPVYKVGFTRSVAARVKALGCLMQSPVRLVALMPGTFADEHATHTRLVASRAMIGASTEHYRETPDFLAWLASLPAEHRVDVLRPWPDARGGKGSRFWSRIPSASQVAA